MSFTYVDLSDVSVASINIPVNALAESFTAAIVVSSVEGDDDSCNRAIPSEFNVHSINGLSPYSLLPKRLISANIISAITALVG